jgi:hypothetical protein
MKRYIPLILLAIPFFADSCSDHKKKPEERKVPSTEQGTKGKDPTAENLDKLSLTEENPSASQQKRAAKQQQKKPKIEAKAQNIVQEYPESKDLRFNNPGLDKWSSTYLNDPQWQEQYSASVSYYLSSVQRNLDQNPERKTDKSTIVSNYREKMSQTFYRSPEFVEFARSQFEKSLELSAFLVRNGGQITVD